ncbi:MAG: hypothetical protein K2O69_04020 [Odoribacter sp.]|nr:hypothetical protein [Odoribacter sp.]
MKQFNICLSFFLALLALTSCEKEHTGYLFTENAKFPINTLTLFRQESYQNTVNRLETQLNSYTGEIADSLKTLQVLEEKEAEIEREVETLEKIALKEAAAYYAYIEEIGEDARARELFQKAKEAQDKQLAKERVLASHQELVNKNQKKIAELCKAQNLENPINIRQELKELKKQFQSDIPWTTSCIEQLLGTEPIIYTLESLHSDQGEAAAADFAKYLTVIGGGRMYVDTKVNSPAGKYVVSLRVSNDGYSVVLPDAFTFILQ